MLCLQACRGGHTECVESLLAAGARTCASDFIGRTGYDLALRHGSLSCCCPFHLHRLLPPPPPLLLLSSISTFYSLLPPLLLCCCPLHLLCCCLRHLSSCSCLSPLHFARCVSLATRLLQLFAVLCSQMDDCGCFTVPIGFCADDGLLQVLSVSRRNAGR